MRPPASRPRRRCLLETRVSERLTTKFEPFEILPFQSANLSKAQYLLTGTMTRVASDGTAKKRACKSTSRSPS